MQSDPVPDNYVSFVSESGVKLVIDMNSVKSSESKKVKVALGVYIFTPPMKQGKEEIEFLFKEATYDCSENSMQITSGQMLSKDVYVDANINELQAIKPFEGEIETICTSTTLES